MRTLPILRLAISQLGLKFPPRHILELGAGDGTQMLRLARSQAALWPEVELTLLDQHDLVSAPTREAFSSLGWRVSVLKADILQWARAPSPHYDLCLTTLFLHHFTGDDLVGILAAVAARADAFVACEPRRHSWAKVASRLVGLIGGNAVTRSDAVASVAAGFNGQELSQAWPHPASWIIEETHVLPFSHCFSARTR